MTAHPARSWSVAPTCLAVLFAGAFLASPRAQLPSTAVATAQPGTQGYGYRLAEEGSVPAGATVVEDYGTFRWIVAKGPLGASPDLSAPESAVPPLRFRGRAIAAPPVTDQVRASLANRSNERAAYLIQLAGPVKTREWLRELDKTGIQRVNYVPENGFLVWGSGAQMLKLLALRTSTGYPMVQSVADVTWEERLEPALNAMQEGLTPPGTDASWTSGGPIPLHLWAFSKDGLSDLLQRVKGSDPAAKITDDAGDTYVSASLSLADVVALASTAPALKYAEIVRPKVLHNDLVPLPQVCNVEPEWTAGWTGAGVIVDHNDSGVDTTHADFPAAAIQATSGPMTTASDNTHGTHTAGSVLGRGLAAATPTNTSGCGDQFTPESTVRGMAWGAKLATNNIFDSGGIAGDSTMMQWGSQQGASLSTNSWGYGTQTSPDTTYDSHAIAMDNAVRDADSGTAGNQQLAIFFSAGNSGSGASTVGSPGLAKDVVTVGASQNARCGSYVPTYQAGPDINTVAAFSSRGPSQGRIKPDVCTPGTDVLSVQSAQATTSGLSWDQSWTGSYYALDAGTSMSCPLTTGMGADFFQFYQSTFGKTPSPALVKAALINGAVDMGLGYPNNSQGWGRTNLKNTIEGPSGGTVDFLDQGDTTPLATGGQYAKQFSVTSSSVPLKITLVWTDPPGAASCSSCLINNLDLEVLASDGTPYHGNQFTGSWSTASASAWDTANNVENVFVQAPSTGVWTIHVKGTAVNVLPTGVTGGQDFALVYSGAVAPPCTAPGTPTGLGATTPADNQVALSWTAGNPAGSTYRVYRAVGSCASPGSFSLLASGITGTSYTDTAANGGTTYAYEVTAVDASGACESSPSACADATATGPCILAPTFAGVASVTNPGDATCTLSLSWAAATPQCNPGDGVYYNVYRSTTSPFTPAAGNRIATGVVGTAFSDASGLSSGTTYYYVVRAVDSANGGEDANTATAGAKVSGPYSSGTFLDNVESGKLSQVTQQDANWSIQTCKAHSATHSWHMGQTDCTGIPIDGGTYSIVYSLSVAPYSTLGSAQFFHTFQAYYNGTYNISDAIYFEIDPTNSGTWTTVASWRAIDGAWSTMTEAGPYDLSAYNTGASGVARFRFRFTGGASWLVGNNSAAGWDVDDFQVSYVTAASCATGSAPGSVKPVPDGQWVAGTPMKASKVAADGSTDDLTWDVSTCTDANYNLYWGNGGDLATYALQGSDCGLGNTGSATGVSIPAVPSGQTFIWWVLAGTDGGAMESSWGKDSAGNERHPAASGQCGFTAKSTATGCP